MTNILRIEEMNLDSRHFRWFVNYIKSHPEGRAALREALGAIDEKEPSTWVGVKECAQMIGKSITWVKGHKEIWSGGSLVASYSESGRKAWKFRKADILEAYEAYIKRN